MKTPILTGQTQKGYRDPDTLGSKPCKTDFVAGKQHWVTEAKLGLVF